MKQNKTELVFILDRSGSMSGLEDDTIGGFNSMIEKQKEEKGDAFVTTVLFDNKYELLHDRQDIKSLNTITRKEYYVRGSTALLDAIGITINNVRQALFNLLEEQCPDKVVFVIITDGMENASTEYSYRKIKEMIEHQKSKYAWEFMFLGANIDAVKTAESFGITEDRATNFCSDSQGTQLNYKVISEAVSCFRQGKKVTADWKEEIEDDYKKRSRK